MTYKRLFIPCQTNYKSSYDPRITDFLVKYWFDQPLFTYG